MIYLTKRQEEKIVIDLDGFDCLDECMDDEGELDLELTKQLNEMLIELFEENNYTLYTIMQKMDNLKMLNLAHQSIIIRTNIKQNNITIQNQ